LRNRESNAQPTIAPHNGPAQFRGLRHRLAEREARTVGGIRPASCRDIADRGDAGDVEARL
jgi:hypothetical protein